MHKEYRIALVKLADRKPGELYLPLLSPEGETAYGELQSADMWEGEDGNMESPEWEPVLIHCTRG